MRIYIGYDPRETNAFAVARHSAKKHTPLAQVRGILMSDMRKSGQYTRETIEKDGHLFDVISDAPMSTEFAITRFLVPRLGKRDGVKWCLFMDCDMLVRSDLNELLDLADDRYAIMCVKHNMEQGKQIKMDGCVQTAYSRKNWSSVMLFNCEHPAHDKLTLDMVNGVPGRDLHAFSWLTDDEIGELGCEWNHLVGVNPPNPYGKIIHYTLGIPSMPGYENCEYADEWRDELAAWARW